MPKLVVTHKTGAYRIYNLLNGKVYVGGAYVNLDARLSHHLSCLRGGYHGNVHLQAAWNRYGEQSFVFEVLERCPQHLVLACEQKWLDHYKSYDRKQGYNICSVAESSLGVRRTPEAKRRLSELIKRPGVQQALIDASRTPEALAKRSKSLRGIVKTKEWREKISKTLTGRKPSPEAIEKTASKLRGKKRPESLRQKLRVALTGNTNGRGRKGKKYGPLSDAGYLKKYGRSRQ